MPYLTRLTLTDFRSYATADVVAVPGLIAVTGDNGAGKTNLLEAISLLAPGRGLRGLPLSEMTRSGGPGGFGIAVEIAAPGGNVAIGTGVAAAAPDRRLLRINGAAAPAGALGEWLSVLWLTPVMDRLFSEPASGRRRFLDRLVLALVPGHASQAARYDAAMRARTRLLTGDTTPDPQWLDALERQMAEHGEAVTAARVETVAALDAALAAALPGPFPAARVSLDDMSPADLASALRQSRAADTAAGRATVGPHRADLAVIHAAKGQPASRGSTGEQKALLIGIVLAHAGLVADKLGRTPLLLLDEIAAHLDPGRRAALFERLEGTGAQVWMTGTEAALFDGIAAQRLNVSDGRVSR
ncbi:DNA replication/repair protein RecF [Sphingosinicellaceae bacterium]|nr:DNA replication/repair protein RecF [Sphingosinicellaceae bacterium]